MAAKFKKEIESKYATDPLLTRTAAAAAAAAWCLWFVLFVFSF